MTQNQNAVNCGKVYCGGNREWAVTFKNLRANLHFCTSDVHRRWFILSERERWKLEYLYLSMVQFVSLVFKMSATV